MGIEVVDRWLEPLRLVSATESAIVLHAPNHFFRDWVASHYVEAISSCAGNRPVQLVTAPAGLTEEAPRRPVPAGPAGAEQSLNPRFTFDEFVVGPSNRFAHAACLAVAESPARAYNPLFIYGGVGLGKTHLMQAIGHAVSARWPQRRVVYGSSEGFTNDLITAIQTKTTARFRDRYRTVDVLLIDDIHFIAGKEATQEEFFHTFNALYDAHRQIVISSDRPPKDIAGLEERLVSRFEWGLVTDIQPPDLETRIAILRRKAQHAQAQVSSDVIDFIARQITSNIRELEGALIRVLAYCQFFGRAQTPAVAQEVLRDMVREVRSRITLEGVQQRVAEHFQLSIQELRGARRHRSVLLPRQIAMYLCRRLTEASLPEIGRAFGGRDHTTVMHAIHKIERDVAQDAHRRRLVEHLHSALAGERHPPLALFSPTPSTP